MVKKLINWKKPNKSIYLPYGWTEQLAKDYFIEKGYSVNRIKGVGAPDFFVTGNKDFFVEVKRNFEPLRKSQINWIKRNPSKKVIVFRVMIIFEELKVSDLIKKMGGK